MSSEHLLSNQQTLNAAFANTVVTVVNERREGKRFIVSNFNQNLQPQGVMFEPRPSQTLTLVNLLYVFYQVRPQLWIPMNVLVPLDVVLGKSPVDTNLLPASNATAPVDFLEVFQRIYRSLDSLRPLHMTRNLGRTVILSSNHSPICNITTNSLDVWLPQELNLTALQSHLPSAGRYVQFFYNGESHQLESYCTFLTFLGKACGLSPSKKWAVDSTGLFFFGLALGSVPPFDAHTRLVCFIACPGLYGCSNVNHSIYHHASSSFSVSSSSSLSPSPLSITAKSTSDASQQTDSQTSSSFEETPPDDFQSYCAEHGILLPPTNPEGCKIYEFYLLGKKIATNNETPLAETASPSPLSSSDLTSSSFAIPCPKECCSKTPTTPITEQIESSTQTEIGGPIEEIETSTQTELGGPIEEIETSTQTELGGPVDEANASKGELQNHDLLSNKSMIPLSEASFWKYETYVFFTCSTSLVPVVTPFISYQIALDNILQSSLVLCILSTTAHESSQIRQVYELRLGHLLAINELRLLLCREDSCDLWGNKVVLTPIHFGPFRLCLFSSEHPQSSPAPTAPPAPPAPTAPPASTEQQFIAPMDLTKATESAQPDLTIATQAKRPLSTSIDEPEQILKKQKRDISTRLSGSGLQKAKEEKQEKQEEQEADENVSFKQETIRLLTLSFGTPFPLILKSDENSLSKKHRFLTEDGHFVNITGCEFDVHHYRLQKFHGIFKNEKFFIIENDDELIPIRDFVLRFCRPSIRAIVCLCYQVRHNVWIPLLPVAISLVLKGRIRLNSDLLPRITEHGSPSFLAMVARECNPASDTATVDPANVLSSRRRRM